MSKRIYAFASGSDPAIKTVATRHYQSYRSAERYANQHGLFISNIYDRGHEEPRTNDAYGWDQYRLYYGIAAR